jgi:transposase InsO family protein
VLVELRLVEQRHKAVLEVLAGASITDVAVRNGVTRQTVHRWLRRYASLGLAGLADHSCRPARCPHQMAPETEARILELREAHPGWGPRTLRHQLEREGVVPLPGRSSVYRLLVRHGLVDPQKRRRKREDYRRWERSRSMELWQMDVMGGVKLAAGGDLMIVTGLDDHSRFCVSAMLVPRATARPVCEALALAMRRHGVPEQILTDNGKVFTARFGPGKGQVLFDRICQENGIKHLLTAPRSPTTTGKVERFHKTVRAEFLSGRVFASLEEAQEHLDAWVRSYNEERPHQGIGMVPPAKRFALAAPEPFVPIIPDPEEENVRERPPRGPEARVTRRVGGGGGISLCTFPYHVGAWLAGETVDVVSDDRLVEVFHRGVLVATHARRHPLEVTPAIGGKKPPRPGDRRPARPQPGAVVGVPVIRKVAAHGDVSFADARYAVGPRHAGKDVEIRLVGDVVQIYLGGILIRTHRATHDPSKLHGAFGVPGGRPRKKKAS